MRKIRLRPFSSLFFSSFSLFSLWILPLAIPLPLQAKPLETSYLITKVPDDWTCKLADQQWICQSTLKGYDTRLVASFLAKQALPEENIENFLGHFKSSKYITSKSGRSLVSKVIYVKKVSVNRVTWVEALHFQSEVPNYYTQYMVTVNGGVSILLQLSAHKDIFEVMKPYFTSVILNTRLKKLGTINPPHSSPSYTKEPSQPSSSQLSAQRFPPQTQGSQTPTQSSSFPPLVIAAFILITTIFLGGLLLKNLKKKDLKK